MKRAFIFVLLSFFTAGTAADAAPKKKNKSARAAAKKHFDVAETHYKLGRFEEALDAYSKAYEALPEPAFLFNMGQCHRNLGNVDRALYFFRGFLREGKDDATRKKVRDLIAQLEKRRAEEDRRREAAAAAAAAAATAALTATVTVETRTTTAVVYVPGPERIVEDESTPAWPFVVAAAIVAAVAGGVAIAVASSGDGLPDDLVPDRTVDWRDR